MTLAHGNPMHCAVLLAATNLAAVGFVPLVLAQADRYDALANAPFSENLLPASDASAFDQLKLLVDSEGPHLADPDWLGMLASIGIVKGKPFNPDEHTQAILDDAARAAYKMSRVVGFEEVVSGRNFRVYPDRRWESRCQGHA